MSVQRNFGPHTAQRMGKMMDFPTLDEMPTGEGGFSWEGTGPGRSPGPKDMRWCTYGFLMACQWFLNAAGDGTQLDRERFHKGLAKLAGKEPGLPEREYLEALAAVHEIKAPSMRGT